MREVDDREKEREREGESSSLILVNVGQPFFGVHPFSVFFSKGFFFLF